MGKALKKSKSSNRSESVSIRNRYNDDFQKSESDYDDENGEELKEEYDDDDDDQEEIEEDDEQYEDDEQEHEAKSDGEMAALEKEYADIRQEVDIFKNLKNYNAEEATKGESLKNQKSLWENALEFRILLQKPFSSSNKLPINHIRSSFCVQNHDINLAYSDLISTCVNTINSLCNLQESLISANSSIVPLDNNGITSDLPESDEWTRIYKLKSRFDDFRDKSVNKWHEKTQVSTGSAAIHARFDAFNQNVSDQVAAYMKNPSRKIKSMQQTRSAVEIFGSESMEESVENDNMIDGDPDLLDDSEFYQQLLKEFLENIDPNASETAFYMSNRNRKKKRKKVDRRASKSRKIRYNVHEKLVNFMAPRSVELPPMAPMLFSNLFGLKTYKNS